MNIKDLLSKNQLVEIKKIGEVSEELKAGLYDQKLNTKTRKILMQIVDEDTEDLIKAVIDDVFFEYMNKKTEIENRE